MGLFRVSNDAETVKSPWDGTRRIRDFAAGHCALQLMRSVEEFLFLPSLLGDTPGCPERQAVRLRDGCAFGCGTSPCFCQGPSRCSRVCVTPLPGQEKEGIIILFHHSGRTARGKEKLRRSSYAVHERRHVLFFLSQYSTIRTVPQ